MSLNPSNQMSEQITGKPAFPNVAGLGKTDPKRVDDLLAAELATADIEVQRVPEVMREKCGGEPQSIVIGELFGWRFRRAWYYWVAEGPGIPVEFATPLHEAQGKSVRVEGDCSCPSPMEHSKGRPIFSYHVDNQDGLNALALTIVEATAKGVEAFLAKRVEAARAARAAAANAEAAQDWQKLRETKNPTHNP